MVKLISCFLYCFSFIYIVYSIIYKTQHKLITLIFLNVGDEKQVLRLLFSNG